MGGPWIRRTGIGIANAIQRMGIGQKSAAVYAWRGTQLLACGDLENALADLDLAIALEPRLGMAYCNRGVCHQSRGDHGLALADFQRALKAGQADARFRPMLPLVHWNRGISYKTLGEYDRAIEEHSLAIGLCPAFAPAFDERGLVHQLKLAPDRAIADHDRAIQLDARHGSYFKHRGYARFYLGDASGAAEDMRTSLRIEPDVIAALFLYLAISRAGVDRTGEFRQAAQHLPRLEWPFPIVEFYLGMRAGQSLLDAASSAAERGEAQFYIGQRHLLDGDSEAAAAAFQAALADCPQMYSEHFGARIELARLQGTASPFAALHR